MLSLCDYNDIYGQHMWHTIDMRRNKQWLILQQFLPNLVTLILSEIRKPRSWKRGLQSTVKMVRRRNFHRPAFRALVRRWTTSAAAAEASVQLMTSRLLPYKAETGPKWNQNRPDIRIERNEFWIHRRPDLLHPEVSSKYFGPYFSSVFIFRPFWSIPLSLWRVHLSLVALKIVTNFSSSFGRFKLRRCPILNCQDFDFSNVFVENLW